MFKTFVSATSSRRGKQPSRRGCLRELCVSIGRKALEQTVQHVSASTGGQTACLQVLEGPAGLAGRGEGGDCRGTLCAGLEGKRHCAPPWALIEIAKLNQTDLQAWLINLLSRITDYSAKRVEQPAPWNFKKSSRQGQPSHRLLCRGGSVSGRRERRRCEHVMRWSRLALVCGPDC
jgi:hypothetical protein